MINVPLMKWFVSLKKQAKKEVIWLILLGSIGYLYIQINSLHNKNEKLRNINEALQKEKEKQALEITNLRIADKEKVDNKMVEFYKESTEKATKVTDSVVKEIRRLTEDNYSFKMKLEKMIKK